MIRAQLKGKRGQPLLVLGLGKVNIDRLVANDEPIHVELRHFSGTDQVHDDLPDLDLIIAFDDGSLTAKLTGLPGGTDE